MKKTYTKTAYGEKLKDPRWQKLRLEVMSSNEFHCEICGDGEATLHVHHKEYFKGREPWEYEAGQLAVICESCHENQHSKDDFLKLICSFAPLDGPNNRGELAMLIAGHLGIDYQRTLEMSDWDEDCAFPRAAYEAGQNIKAMQDHFLNIHYTKWLEEKNGTS